MPAVNSSQLASIDHDGQKLIVEFKSGGTYEYHGVPQELYDRMMAEHAAGASIGKSFHSNIKHGGFRHTKR